MRVWPGWLFLIVTVSLGACAPVPQGGTPAARGDVPARAATGPAIAVDSLPCADLERTAGLTVAYPAGSLYRGGAALPSQEGLACLDALAGWLQGTTPITWQVSVGGENAAGFDPQALADKRQELLQRYFLRKGIDTSGWTWRAEAGQAGPLRFTSSP